MTEDDQMVKTVEQSQMIGSVPNRDTHPVPDTSQDRYIPPFTFDGTFLVRAEHREFVTPDRDFVYIAKIITNHQSTLSKVETHLAQATTADEVTSIQAEIGRLGIKSSGLQKFLEEYRSNITTPGIHQEYILSQSQRLLQLIKNATEQEFHLTDAATIKLDKIGNQNKRNFSDPHEQKKRGSKNTDFLNRVATTTMLSLPFPTFLQNLRPTDINVSKTAIISRWNTNDESDMSISPDPVLERQGHPVEQLGIEIFFPLTTLPPDINVRTSANTALPANIAFNTNDFLSYNSRANTADLGVQIVGVNEFGQDAFNIDNTVWYIIEVTGPEIPDNFQGQFYVYSELLNDLIASGSATRGATREPVTQAQIIEAFTAPAEAGTATPPPTDGSGGDLLAGREQPVPPTFAPQSTPLPEADPATPVGTDPAVVVEPTREPEILPPGAGVPGALDPIEVVDAGGAMRTWVDIRTDPSILNNPEWSYNPVTLAYEMIDDNGVILTYRVEMGETIEQETMRETWRFTSNVSSGTQWTMIIEMNGLHPEGVVTTPPQFQDENNRTIFQTLWETQYPFLRNGGTYIFSISDQYAGRQSPPGVLAEITTIDHLAYTIQQSGRTTIVRTLIGRNEGLDYGTFVAISTALQDIKTGASQQNRLVTETAHLDLFNRTALALQDTENTGLGYVIPFPETPTPVS